MRKIFNSFLVIVCSAAMLNVSFFFTFMGLLGIEYEGAESSNVYVSYIVLVAGLSLLIYLYGLKVQGMLKHESILIFMFLCFFSLHILWFLFDSNDVSFFSDFFIFFLLLGLPGFFSAATIIKLKITPQMIRFSEIMFIIMACGITVFSVLPTFAGIRIASLAGATYQVLSYISAFTFGMLLIYNIYLPKSLRLPWASFYWYKWISYGLILSCVLGCFIGGGRGAFLLLIFYLLLISLSVFSNKSKKLTQKTILNMLLRFFIIILLVVMFFNFFWERDFIQSGFSRATQFISKDGGIDLQSGSSGRNVVYEIAIDYILERPLIGYGPFNFREQTIQAHNLFLEILLQFGVIGFIVFLFLLWLFFINAIRNWSVYNYWAFGLLLYPLIMTMFSGAYMHSAEFVFGVTFITMYKKVKPKTLN